MEKYIGRKMLGFYNVDLCDKKAMMECFSKVKKDNIVVASVCYNLFAFLAQD